METVTITPKGWIAVGIFALSYIAIATDKFDRAMIAVVGATLMLALGIVNQETAFMKIDLNVILLLAGMMVMVNVIKRSGLFEWLALSSAKLTGGHPRLLLFVLPLVAGLTSAFLDNVTTMILLTPMTLIIADTLRIDPVPLIISETFASNIGGTATLIGDPPHMLIGSAAGLSFLDFLVNLAPVVLIILAVFLFLNDITYRKRYKKTQQGGATVAAFSPRKAIKDPYLMWKSVGVLGLILALFMFHHLIPMPHPAGILINQVDSSKPHMLPATVALIGASLLLILCQLPPRKGRMDSMGVLLSEVDWPTLFFFIGMFVMVAGLNATGVIDAVAGLLVNLTRTHMLFTALLVLWGSAFMTMVLSAVPFVVAIIPVIQIIHAQGGGNVIPLWWALSLGAALGANGTFIGSAANLVVIGISNRSGHRISFGEFTKRGIPLTVISLVISSLYIWLRYFWPEWL
ncbi:ArsB/NhaD family transporter [candidate division WOR-3 bacterium]|nr:ArsB/NhaD family transporter [candidate division WOR-3 bacterium]